MFLEETKRQTVEGNKMVNPDFSEYRRLAKISPVVPVWTELVADTRTPVGTFLKLSSAVKGKPDLSFLLESVSGGEHWARYSFIGRGAEKIFVLSGDSYAFVRPEDYFLKKITWQKFASGENPLVVLRQFFSRYLTKVDFGLPRFWGGMVGYFGYDLVRFLEKLPANLPDSLKLPDALFILNKELIIFDHLSQKMKLLVLTFPEDNIKNCWEVARRQLQELIKIITCPDRPEKTFPKKSTSVIKIRSNTTPPEFFRMVRKVKNYIRRGDIIQAVISQRFSAETKVNGFSIYRALRLINPSPYMYYLNFSDWEMIGSSPEILVRHQESQIETRPIAGTRPRGKDEKEDRFLEEQLKHDPKERAEHIMLVDLGRNDIGRIAVGGSVRVPQLMAVERYSHVMHLVSTVSGRLDKKYDSFDVLGCCFPAGTVSGAPKVRAMEIIDEVEKEKRGPYAGAVGYFSFSGNMDMAITIRTIIKKGKKVYVQAGAGIVADSQPEREYQETRNKAAALFAAIQEAEKFEK